jgi:hypothetical protein
MSVALPPSFNGKARAIMKATFQTNTTLDQRYSAKAVWLTETVVPLQRHLLPHNQS